MFMEICNSYMCDFCQLLQWMFIKVLFMMNYKCFHTLSVPNAINICLKCVDVETFIQHKITEC